MPLEVLKFALTGVSPPRSQKLRSKIRPPLCHLAGVPCYVPSKFLNRLIRALHPWPGAFTKIKINSKEKRLKLLEAHLEADKLVLDQVQLEGKNPVTWKQFCEGYPETDLSR